MTENIQEGQQVAETTQEGQIETKQVDYSAEIEKAKLELEEKFKSEIAGLNRKNSELQNTLKKKELEGKTDAEQLEMIKAEKQKVENEIAELNRGRLIDRELNSAGLPLEFAKRIIGSDEANIKEDIKNFSEYVEKLAQDKADKIINERLGGGVPQAGITPGVEQIKRIDFEQKDPLKQRELIKSGVEIID